MPIYEYACKDCKTMFEMLVLNSAEKITCPSCDSTHLHKLISAHAVGNSASGPACDMPACGSGVASPCASCPALQ